MDTNHDLVNHPAKISLPAILILLLINFWIWQPPHWVHHLDPLLTLVHLHSQDQDHHHPQTTRSENSHQQQVEEECLALGCPTPRKLLPLQSPLAFLDVFDDIASGLVIFQEQDRLRIEHFVYCTPVRGPPV
ncbi:MAG: hypothetical protein CL934_13870 [Deltaproteobacteria bacterium]|nr:hypothetical protein [Deltaproteobacteria bacterium]